MNHATFAGYLGRDAELRSTPSGQQVLNFSVAVNVGFGDKKKTLWIGCAIWGERAEKLGKYLVKGTAVAVAGDVDLRTYDTRDGKHGAEITLNVQRVTLLGGRGGGKDEAPASEQTRTAPAAAAPADFDEDIPF